MTNNQERANRRDFLQGQSNAILKWVPYYQIAPRNQLDPHSTYTPIVTCDVEQLLFDATVSAAPNHHPRYHFSVAVPLALTYVAMALTATEEFMPEMPLDRSLTVREGSKRIQPPTVMLITAICANRKVDCES